jgi:hypothetical protein
MDILKINRQFPISQLLSKISYNYPYSWMIINQLPFIDFYGYFKNKSPISDFPAFIENIITHTPIFDDRIPLNFTGTDIDLKRA